MTVKAKILWTLAAAMLLLGGVAAFVAGRYYVDNKMPNFTQKHVLYVYPDMTVAQVMDSLHTGAGTIRPKSVDGCVACHEAGKICRRVFIKQCICGQNACLRMADSAEYDPFGHIACKGTHRAEDRLSDACGFG